MAEFTKFFKVSNDRASELKNSISDYSNVKNSIKTGYDNFENSLVIKMKILKQLNATEDDWNNWEWQFKNSYSDVKMLSEIIDLSSIKIEEIKNVESKFRWKISPYYLSLININNQLDPIKLQSIPQIYELSNNGKFDPMSEEYTTPVKGITRRYPDRLIINVTNICGMYCRHCQRRRNIGTSDISLSTDELNNCFKYIKENTEIRDVLLTGGDVLCISDNYLEWIIKNLREIDTVEIIRLGTRTPVVMPQRITEKLCKMLSKYHPIYINTHFNSPSEITYESKIACEMLSNFGIILGNQTVMLKGINNDSNIMKKLNQELLKIRVRPYYVFHPKDVIGTKHFYVKIVDGIEIMSKLRGETSGLAIPTYIINAPNGLGKIPLFKKSIVSSNDEKTVLLTWENKIVEIIES